MPIGRPVGSTTTRSSSCRRSSTPPPADGSAPGPSPPSSTSAANCVGAPAGRPPSRTALVNRCEHAHGGPSLRLDGPIRGRGARLRWSRPMPTPWLSSPHISVSFEPTPEAGPSWRSVPAHARRLAGRLRQTRSTRPTPSRSPNRCRGKRPTSLPGRRPTLVPWPAGRAWSGGPEARRLNTVQHRAGAAVDYRAV